MINCGISIIIPNWNGKELLEQCIPSIIEACRNYSGPSEIIVVDDGSKDGSADFLEQKFPGIRVLCLSKNRGYGYACNWGIAHCSHQLIVLLNNDVLVKSDFLNYIPAYFQEKDVFGVRVRTLDFDKIELVEKGSPISPAKWTRGEFKFGLIYVPAEISCPQEESSRGKYAFNVGAGAFAADKEKWLQLGGFDDLFYPFYVEETDISYRALKRGWKIISEPRSVVFHKGSGFTISKAKKRWYVNLIGERNRYFLVWKNLSDYKYLFLHIFYAPLRLIRNLFKGDLVSFAAFFYGLFWIPKVIQRRRREKREVILSDREIFDFFDLDSCRNEINSGKLSFVCSSINNWEDRRARKQQFMLNLALRNDVSRVLYLEPALNFWHLVLLPFKELAARDNRLRWKRALRFKAEASTETSKLMIFTPVFFIPFSFRYHSQTIYNFNLYFLVFVLKSICRKLELSNVVLWIYHPFNYPLLRWFKDRISSCFDWAEDWALYFTELGMYKRKLVVILENKLIAESDNVFVVSKMLLSRAKILNSNSHQLLDGTSPEIFFNCRAELPGDMAGIKHPIIGYDGTISSRLDLELIVKLARELPDSSIVLVGKVLLTGEKLKLLKLHNIFMLGGKKYTELPNYMMHFDACILPYLSSKVFAPPTKIYDYLATGKPFVSMDIPELDAFRHCISVAKTHEQFIEMVRASLKENDQALVEIRKNLARENSWEKRTEQLLGVIRTKIAQSNSGSAKRILVIPHHPSVPIVKIRLAEIAKSLAKDHKVYLLHWKTAISRRNLFFRSYFALVNFLVKMRVYSQGNLQIVELPLLMRPLALGCRFNSSSLKKFIKEEKIDLLINGSYHMFSIPQKRNFCYLVDIADLPVLQIKNNFERFLDRQVRKEISKADHLTVSSQGLVKYCSDNYLKTAEFIPNGADIDQLRSVSREKVELVRKKYNLSGKYVIGYVGHIGNWVNLELLRDSFVLIKEKIPQAILFFVGSYPEEFKKQMHFTEAVFAGAVKPEEIAAYFGAIDLGIIPSRKSLFQDLAFHIKVIEYTAAGKKIVATDLEELKLLGLPNLVLADEFPLAWAEAIDKAATMYWQDEWNNLVNDYNWDKISEKLVMITGRADA